MENAKWTLSLLIAALVAGPAAAVDPGPVGDPAVDLKLTLAPEQLPIFLLEANTLMGFELDGVVTWTVNGMFADQDPIVTIAGSYLDLKTLPLAEAAIVCANVDGRLLLAGDLGRDVFERDCVLWLPSDRPVRPVTGLRDLLVARKPSRPLTSGASR